MLLSSRVTRRIDPPLTSYIKRGEDLIQVSVTEVISGSGVARNTVVLPDGKETVVNNDALVYPGGSASTKRFLLVGVDGKATYHRRDSKPDAAPGESLLEWTGTKNGWQVPGWKPPTY